MQSICLTTPIGTLCIEETNDAISAVNIINKECSKTCIVKTSSLEPVKDSSLKAISSLLMQTCKELSEYFEGKRKTFSVPIAPNGTEFQKKVWEQLRTIPYGQTRTYGEIAEAIENAKASRAVGGANNKNNILILIPCHRVIGKNGSLVGFACGLEIKQKLLELEKSN